MSHMHNGPQAFMYRLYSWLVQECCISSADALEILQSCTKPSNQYTEMSSGSSKDALSNPNLAQVCARPSTAWNNFFYKLGPHQLMRLWPYAWEDRASAYFSYSMPGNTVGYQYGSTHTFWHSSNRPRHTVWQAWVGWKERETGNALCW